MSNGAPGSPAQRLTASAMAGWGTASAAVGGEWGAGGAAAAFGPPTAWGGDAVAAAPPMPASGRAHPPRGRPHMPRSNTTPRTPPAPATYPDPPSVDMAAVAGQRERGGSMSGIPEVLATPGRPVPRRWVGRHCHGALFPLEPHDASTASANRRRCNGHGPPVLFAGRSIAASTRRRAPSCRVVDARGRPAGPGRRAAWGERARSSAWGEGIDRSSNRCNARLSGTRHCGGTRGVYPLPGRESRGGGASSSVTLREIAPKPGDARLCGCRPRKSRGQRCRGEPRFRIARGTFFAHEDRVPTPAASHCPV